MTNTTNTAKTPAADLTIVADSGTSFTYKGVKPDAAIRHCNCECGAQVVKKAIYRPGHDARHISQLATAIEALADETSRKATVVKAIKSAFEVLPSAKMQVKLASRLFKTLPDLADAITRTLGDVIDTDEDEDGE